MKRLSFVNNVWIERINPNVTSEEQVIIKAVLKDRKTPVSESDRLTIENVKARSSKVADQTDAETAQAIYDQHKIANSNLISVDISLPSGKGIINCRTENEQHKQIRF